jgi:hypothetical protein
MDLDYFDFSPTLKKMLSTGLTVRKDGEVVEVGGGASTLNNLRLIREILLDLKPTNTMEVGLAYGASALSILGTLKENKVEPFCHTAIDPFQTKRWGGSSIRSIEEENCADNFIFHEGYSSFVLPELIQKGHKFEFIYVDGSHLFEDVFLDFYYSTILLQENGLVLFDDCGTKDVDKVIKFIQRNYSLILKPFDLAPYEDPNKSVLKRLANKLGYRQLKAFQKIKEPPRPWDSSFAPF